MIHSMSGGVLAQNGRHIFVKVEIGGAPYWYLSPFAEVKAGDRVSVPFGRGELPTEGVVLKVEEADGQCAPYPMNRIKEIYEILA